MSEQHPVRRGEEHPALNIVERLFLALQSEPEQAGHEPECDSLNPVESGQHTWPRLLEVALT